MVQPPELVLTIIFCKLCELPDVNVATFHMADSFLGFLLWEKEQRKVGDRHEFTGGAMERNPEAIGGFHTLTGLLAIRKQKGALIICGEFR